MRILYHNIEMLSTNQKKKYHQKSKKKFVIFGLSVDNFVILRYNNMYIAKMTRKERELLCITVICFKS